MAGGDLHRGMSDDAPSEIEQDRLGEARTLAARAGERLRKREETLAVAESATGGLVGSLATDVPGASDYFDRAVVTYSYDAKRELLAVTRERLDEHGAVSAPVARQMARAVRDTTGATWGVATTGIAGPTGGDGDPVGTVYVSVARGAPWGTNDSDASVERYAFDGDRRERKAAFARQAFADLLDRLEVSESTGPDGD